MSAADCGPAGLAINSGFDVASRRAAAGRVIGRITDAGPGFDAVLLTDMRGPGVARSERPLSRIDVRLAEGAAGAAPLARLRAQLPADLSCTRRARKATRLRHDGRVHHQPEGHEPAGVLVGAFYLRAVSFAVRSARTIAVLRRWALPRRVLAVCSAKRRVGVVGAPLRVLLGLAIGRVWWMFHRHHDLYFVVTVRE